MHVHVHVHVPTLLDELTMPYCLAPYTALLSPYTSLQSLTMVYCLTELRLDLPKAGGGGSARGGGGGGGKPVLKPVLGLKTRLEASAL